MSTMAGVLLAAGESRRMGDINKLSLVVDDKPLLRRAAETLLNSRLSTIVVVLGHDSNQGVRLLADLPVQIVLNDAYREGQMTSVCAGLKALRGSFDGVMICLADQPLLTAADVDRLISAFASAPDCSVLVPVRHGQRGNPIILNYEHRAAILADDRNLGCRRFIERHPELVTTLAVESDHYVVDLDTPDDYAALLSARGQPSRAQSRDRAKATED